MRTRLTAFIAALGVVLMSTGLVMFTAPAASAHHNTISATTECQPDGTWRVTWTIKNSEANRKEQLSNASRLASEINGKILAGGGLLQVTETVPNNAGTLTLKVTGSWDNNNNGKYGDKDRNGQDVVSTNQGSVTVKGTCAQKPANKVETAKETRKSCEAGVEERTKTTTKEYVWDSSTKKWVLEPQAQWEVAYSAWVKVRDLTNAERNALKCRPDAVVVHEKETKESCEYGVQERTKTTVKEYVKSGNKWVLEDPAQWEVTYSAWTKVRDLTKTEKKDLGCYGTKPADEKSSVTEDRSSCEAGVEERTVTTTKEYVLTEDGWVLEPEQDWSVVDSGWVKVRDLTGAEKKAKGCYGNEPPAKVVKDEDDKTDCSGKFERTVTTTKEYVLTDEGWVLEPEKDWTVVDSGWVKVRDLTGAEKKAKGCYGDEPKAIVDKDEDDKTDCSGKFERTVTTTKEYVLTDEGWVLEPEKDWTVVDSGWVKVRDLTGAEKKDLDCYGDGPGDEVVSDSQERSSCEAGVERRTVTTTKEYVLTDEGWVLEPEADWAVVDSGWTKVRDLTPEEALGLGCIKGVQEIAPTVTFTDPTCENPAGAGWSGTFTDVVDYQVDGSVAAGGNVVVTAAVKPSAAGQVGFPAGFDATFEHAFPALDELDCVLGTETAKPKPTKGDKPERPVVRGTAQAVPTAVAAGVPGGGVGGGGASGSLSLIGGGLLLLGLAGWMTWSAPGARGTREA